MKLKLVKIDELDYSDLSEMIFEWKKDQEINHTNHSPWSIFRNDIKDFNKYKKELENKSEKDGLVPDSVFFAVDLDNKRIVGAVNIRHRLNESLLSTGGHIGYGVRPSERKKGYCTEILRLALLECKKLGINKVLVCCDKNNIGSKKVIIKNGGILENEVKKDNEIALRFWISL